MIGTHLKLLHGSGIFLSAIVCLGLVASANGTMIGPRVVQDDPNVALIQGQLYEVDLNGTATLTPIGPNYFEYNNMGYRAQDGFIYGIELFGTGTNPGNRGVVRVNPMTGAATNLGVPLGLGGGSDPLPTGTGTRFDAGDVSADGSTLYISFGFSTNTPTVTATQAGKLYSLNLPMFLANSASDALDVISITGAVGAVHDWAYNPLDGHLYGADATGGQLAKLNPTTGVRTDSAVAGLPSGTAYGAAWWDPRVGNLFVYKNDGVVYEIDVATPSIVDSWTAPASSRNDGAFVVPEPSSLGLLALGGIGWLLRRRR